MASIFPSNVTLEPVMPDDQQRACDWLLSLARVRAGTTETALPAHVLNRWSVPLLVGPSSSGKEFVCQEVARRLGNLPCRRWDMQSWSTVSNRNVHSTLDQLLAFVEANPAGGIIYLAGVDAFTTREGDDHNRSYLQSVISEITHFLDEATTRPSCFSKRSGELIKANTLVVVGGCFAELWGDVDIGGPGGAEAWKLADPEPLAAAEVARWLLERSVLPASILRRLSPEPLVLYRVTGEQCKQLAVRLRDHLPPALDGFSVEELSDALQGPHGWRGLAALIEKVWVEGHAPVPTVDIDVEAPTPQVVIFDQPAHEIQAQLPLRLGERLGIASNRSRLIAKARRLGLRTAADLDALAVARGYLLPNEKSKTVTTPQGVPRTEFSDWELTAALLSPCIEWDEQVICRGAWMLARHVKEIDPSFLYYDFRLARGEAVVRHVAQLGAEVHPGHRGWRSLRRDLAWTLNEHPLSADVMPDDAIRCVLSALPF